MDNTTHQMIHLLCYVIAAMFLAIAYLLIIIYSRNVEIRQWRYFYRTKAKENADLIKLLDQAKESLDSTLQQSK